MKNKKLKFSIVFVLVLVLTVLHAQEAIPVSGGNALGSGGSISYSIGQVVYSANSGTNGSAAQGVQQPYEISVVTLNAEARWISLACSVYPNPATDYLTLKVDNYDGNELLYQLYDNAGNLIEAKSMDSNQTSIPMYHLAPATYFLKVVANAAEVKTFKIIKH
jgi:hypothetical protein